MKRLSIIICSLLVTVQDVSAFDVIEKKVEGDKVIYLLRCDDSSPGSVTHDTKSNVYYAGGKITYSMPSASAAACEYLKKKTQPAKKNEVIKKLAILTDASPFCVKRITALNAKIAVALFKEKGMTNAVINDGLSKLNCLYIDKENVKLEVFKKLQEKKGDSVIHYAQVSIISIGGNLINAKDKKQKYWIAGPYKSNSSVNILKLSNGKYW